MELSLKLGDIGIIQANTCKERTNLVGTESWRVRIMGGGVTWPSTENILNSSIDDYVANILRPVDRTNG